MSNRRGKKHGRLDKRSTKRARYFRRKAEERERSGDNSTMHGNSGCTDSSSSTRSFDQDAGHSLDYSVGSNDPYETRETNQ